MRSSLVAIACAALLGCARPNPAYSLELDSAFPTHQRDLGIAAYDAWNRLTDPEHQFNLDGDAWRGINGVPPQTGGCTHTLGCVRKSDSTFWIIPNQFADQLAGKTNEEIEFVNRTEWLHELGHVLGCDHVAGGVMDPHEAHVEFTDQDIAECRRVGACP